MSKTNRCVVRNQAYSRGKVSNIERHNERKNEHYANGDVELARAGFNVHFKQCEGGYLQAFDKMFEDGAISTRGQKKDAKILDEMIFDVNTSYFEENGGYDYAKSFLNQPMAWRCKRQAASSILYRQSCTLMNAIKPNLNG